jgi:hypothetical protein
MALDSTFAGRHASRPDESDAQAGGHLASAFARLPASA